jgi:hypothetical protein
MRVFAMRDLSPATAVVAHDAGAANIIAAALKTDLFLHRAYVEGPAAAIWREQLPAVQLEASLEEALDGAASLITGTGWGSDLEHAARRIARMRGLHSIAVIDHWVNYASRFTRGGETVLPDQIWITDEYAEAIARRTFPGIALCRMPNIYLDQEVARIAANGGGATRGDLLYVLEPARDEWGRGVPGEFQALDYFVARLGVLNLADGARLRFRLHPSERENKYAEWIARHSALGIELDTAPRLSDAIARANLVAGCNSFAMVVALAAGRRVVCTLPPWAPTCFLPHTGLIHLKELA